MAANTSVALPERSGSWQLWYLPSPGYQQPSAWIVAPVCRSGWLLGTSEVRFVSAVTMAASIGTFLRKGWISSNCVLPSPGYQQLHQPESWHRWYQSGWLLGTSEVRFVSAVTMAANTSVALPERVGSPAIVVSPSPGYQQHHPPESCHRWYRSVQLLGTGKVALVWAVTMASHSQQNLKAPRRFERWWFGYILNRIYSEAATVSLYHQL